MMSFSRSALFLLLASPLFAVVVAVGCSDTTTGGNTTGTTESSGSSMSSNVGGAGGTGTAGGAGTAGGTTGTAGGGGAGAWGPDGGGFGPVQCLNQTYLCGNGIDDDGDGLIDWQDPECLGPCDNSETGLNVDIPGGAGPKCNVDCFWDSNSGSGNDECYWNHACDPLSTAPNFYPEWWNGVACQYNPNANTPGTNLSCAELLNNQPATCEQICPELTPNGCDCFGCCVIYKNGTPHGPVWLGTEDGLGNSACDLANIDDPKKCSPCTQVKGACFNDCGHCELCLGKTELPADCFPPPPMDGGVPVDSGTDGGNPPEQCPAGIQACGLAGQAPCAAGFYCITGCCIEQPE